MNLMQSDEIDSDEEDFLNHENQKKYLKDNFTFKDFWEYKPTRTMIKNEFIQKFDDTCGDKVTQFYNDEKRFWNKRFASIFALDSYGTRAGILRGIIFNHIKKDYSIDFLNENPEWAQGFVQYKFENANKKVKRKPKIIPKKFLKTYDWGGEKNKKIG